MTGYLIPLVILLTGGLAPPALLRFVILQKPLSKPISIIFTVICFMVDAYLIVIITGRGDTMAYALVLTTVGAFKIFRTPLTSREKTSGPTKESTVPIEPAKTQSKIQSINDKPPPEGYFIHDGEAQQGPYALSQITAMWSTGLITATAVYWDTASNTWQPIQAIVGSITNTQKGDII